MFVGTNIIVVSFVAALVVLSLVAVAAATEAKVFERGRDALSCEVFEPPQHGRSKQPRPQGSIERITLKFL
jgi:hypothetical protein